MVTKLIILLVVVTGIIAAAQLMRVYELSAKLRKTGEHEISNRNNRMNAALMLIFMIVLFIGFIWLMLHYGWAGRGESASVHGHELDWLLNLNYVIVIAVFFITNFLLFFFAWKYVKKPGVPAFFYPHNNKLEMVWTVIPAVVLAVIIIFGLRSWNKVTDAASDEAIVIELFAKQFDWTARYSGIDNQLGKFDYKLTEDTKNPYGLMNAETIQMAIDSMETGTGGISWLEDRLNDRHIMLTPEDRDKYSVDLGRKEQLIRLLYQMRQSHDTAGDEMLKDDIVLKDTLYLCKGKQYEFKFRSKDVLHSAYFPHFRQQMNTVPGMTTRLKFTPDKTTEEMRISRGVDDFEFILMCNKICGTSHYKMKMMIVVMEEEDYNKWMDVKSKGVKNADGSWGIEPATFDFQFHKDAKAEAPVGDDAVDAADGAMPADAVADSVVVDPAV
ncbi:MAG: cytochrome c oxidase subunit 2 [Flavobacteriaceae bacterium]|jgi:cytochrome c oxidase subunit 2